MLAAATLAFVKFAYAMKMVALATQAALVIARQLVARNAAAKKLNAAVRNHHAAAKKQNAAARKLHAVTKDVAAKQKQTMLRLFQPPCPLRPLNSVEAFRPRFFLEQRRLRRPIPALP